MVRDFNAVVGREARAQMLAEHGRLPDAITACVGGGSNAIGIFHAFLNDPGVRIVGAEAAGEGIASGRHAASLAAGRVGVLHGNRTYVLCDDDGQITETHSVSRSEEHTSELQSLMRISYAVFCLKKKNQTKKSKRT